MFSPPKENINKNGHRLEMNVSLKTVNHNISKEQPHLPPPQIDSGMNSHVDSPDPLEHGIPILLVDSDKGSLASIAKMLDFSSHQVTMVASASVAMKMIMDGKKEFDAVIANMDLSEADDFNLCKETNRMGILLILTSAKKGSENGAHILVKKPDDELIMDYLGQLQRRKVEQRGDIATTIHLNESIGEGSIHNQQNYRKEKKEKMDVVAGLNNNFNKKICMERTEELHQKFMDVLAHLGEGKCYPKEIWEKMNVPGLTRTQVAIHLQKCRHSNWQPRTTHNRQNKKCRLSTPAARAGTSGGKLKVYGSMPYLDYQNPNLVSVPSSSNNSERNVQAHGIRVNHNAYFHGYANPLEKWFEQTNTNERDELMWNPAYHPSEVPSPTIDTNNSFTMDNSLIAVASDASGYVATIRRGNVDVKQQMSDCLTIENPEI